MGVGRARATRALVLLSLCLPLMACLAASGPGVADVAPLAEEDPGARAIVERAMSIHGGIEAWHGREAVSLTTTWTRYNRGGRAVAARYTIHFPLADPDGTAVLETVENGDPVMMGVEGDRPWYRAGGKDHDDPETLEAIRIFLRRARSLMSLPFRLDAPEHRFRHEGVTVRAGAVADVVSVTRDGVPSGTFHFDRETGRIAGIGSDPDSGSGVFGEYQAYGMHDGILFPTLQVFRRLDAVTGAARRVLSISVDRVAFDRSLPEAPPVAHDAPSM